MELGIVGHDGVALIGTGDYHNNIGSRRPEGCQMTRKTDCQRVMIINDPGFGSECANCDKIRQCAYALVFIAPIVMGNDHNGNIGLLTKDQDLKDEILNHKDFWMEYISEMAAAFSEFPQLRSILQLRGMNDESLCEAFHVKNTQGLIVADSDMDILRTNMVARDLLNIQENEDFTLRLNDIIPNKLLHDFLADEKNEEGIVFHHEGSLLHIGRATDTRFGMNGGMTLIVDELSNHARRSTSILPSGSKSLRAIVGDSGAMQEIRSLILRVAQGQYPILIQGESGTGKELVAKAIHESSPFRDKPMISVNCAMFSDELFESEFFGYDQGAFTGAATKGKPGFLEMADGGTLFLDELEALSLANQAKLLRVIEEQEYYRIGGRKLIRADVRFVGASNAPLEEMVRNKTFREDLFYRLNVINVHMPPLRERPEDILPLFRHFLQLQGKGSSYDIDESVQNRLLQYPWPGNVRELRNAVYYILAMSDGTSNPAITLECLPAALLNGNHAPASSERITPPAGRQKHSAEAFRNTLKQYDNTTEGKRRAATELGISLATLYRLMKKYNI